MKQIKTKMYIGYFSNSGLYRKTKQRRGKWSRKYKQSINCNRPKGFSQKQYCKYSRKKR